MNAAYDYERFDVYVYRGLQRNGPRAATEFARAEEIWAERARK